MELLSELEIETLCAAATEYAKLRNLIPEDYIAGMFEPMIADADRLDLPQLVRKLTEYHTEWIKK